MCRSRRPSSRSRPQEARRARRSASTTNCGDAVRPGHPSRGFGDAETAVSAIAKAHGAERLLIQNLGAGAPAIRRPPELRCWSQVSWKRSSCRCACGRATGAASVHDGVSTRRSTLMAALAHGCPVLGRRARERIAPCSRHRTRCAHPVGDADAFATRPCDWRRTRSDVARSAPRQGLYQARFDWRCSPARS